MNTALFLLKLVVSAEPHQRGPLGGLMEYNLNISDSVWHYDLSEISDDGNLARQISEHTPDQMKTRN